MKQLEAKIAELEKRIAALEARPIVYSIAYQTVPWPYTQHPQYPNGVTPVIWNSSTP